MSLAYVCAGHLKCVVMLLTIVLALNYLCGVIMLENAVMVCFFSFMAIKRYLQFFDTVGWVARRASGL